MSLRRSCKRSSLREANPPHTTTYNVVFERWVEPTSIFERFGHLPTLLPLDPPLHHSPAPLPPVTPTPWTSTDVPPPSSPSARSDSSWETVTSADSQAIGQPNAPIEENPPVRAIV